jgi:hypothetical protein
MLNFDLKWLTLLAIIVLVGAFAFGATSISAALDPVRAANANAVNARTQAQTLRDAVDIKYYEASKQAQFEAQKQQLANQLTFDQQQRAKELALLDEKIETERQMRAQQLALAQQSAQVWSALLDWGGRVLALGIALALLIASGGFTIRQIAQVRHGKGARDWVSNVELGQLNHRIQNQFVALHEKIASLEKRMMPSQSQPTQPYTDSIGGDGHEPAMSGKLKRLTLVKK